MVIIPRTSVYGVNVSQLIRFVRVCSNISNFNYKNTCMKLLYCSKAIDIINSVKHSKWYPFKNIFDFTTAGDWNCEAAVERLPALHYSVDFIFLSFGIIGFIVELWNY